MNGPANSIANSGMKSRNVVTTGRSTRTIAIQPSCATPIVAMYVCAACRRSGSWRETCHHRNSRATRITT
jgi:hypothetical protein